MKIEKESCEYLAIMDEAVKSLKEDYFIEDSQDKVVEALDHLMEIDPEGFDVPEDDATQATFDLRQEKIWQLSVEVANEVASNYPDMESTGA